MGIFGALSTAVTGLRAQSYAIENISGNIANSQTTAFKRQDTSFFDLIPDGAANQQKAGSVYSQSRSTNTVQGDIIPSSVDTHMAVNGSGYFVVGQATGQVDGRPVFNASNFYTRRGDFEIDKNGYLVNSAGYYLKMLPVDPQTGNITGDVPEVIQLGNDIMPAQQTSTVTYRANLPAFPLPNSYDPNVPGSELLIAAGFSQDPRTPTASANPGTVSGGVMTDPADLTAGDITDDNPITISINGGGPVSFTIGTDPGEYNTLDDLVDAINADATLSGSILATNNGGALQITALNNGVTFTVGGAAAAEFGVDGTYASTPGAGTNEVLGQDAEEFIRQSISGGALVVYNEQGAPASLQMRWAKVDSAATGEADTWNLFYQVNSHAGNTEVAWVNAGTDFTFGADGRMNPPVASLNIPNLVVDGVTVGSVQVNFGASGLTQYADTSGRMAPVELNQNGFAAGEVTRVSISGNGRVTAFYSNGQVADIAEIPMVSFNSDNMLKRMDGGAFAETLDSGPPVPGASGTILGASLEGSNTDIADEFTRLIVTQQAYAANTRIVSTADEMLREVLSMKR